MAKTLESYYPPQAIALTIAVFNEEIDVHVVYPSKYSEEDKLLSLKLEQDIKKAYRDYWKTKNERAIDV